jgi:hypothetical protein
VNVLSEVKLEISEKEASGIKIADLDVTEIIGKIRDLVDDIKKINPKGEKMVINVEGFNFSFEKAKGEYDVNLKVNLVLKPKKP